MPIQTIVGNTFYLFDSAAGRLADTVWPAEAVISQIRILSLSTSAAVEFHIQAGTPWFRWAYLANGSTQTFVPSMYVIPMGNVRLQTAIIPTMLTAATAWIDFA